MSRSGIRGNQEIHAKNETGVPEREAIGIIRAAERGAGEDAAGMAGAVFFRLP
jgi:hypothetical protein